MGAPPTGRLGPEGSPGRGGWRSVSLELLELGLVMNSVLQDLDVTIDALPGEVLHPLAIDAFILGEERVPTTKRGVMHA